MTLIQRLLFTGLLVSLNAGATASPAPEFQAVPGWSKPAAGDEQIGNMHGDVAVAKNGEVFISVTAGPKAGIQVFSPDGQYLRNVPGAPNDFHGFVIHREEGGEFIYGSRLSGQNVLKLTLQGEQVLEIPGSSIPEEFKRKGKNGKGALRLTAVDVAPNGDIFTTDGYANGFVHRFDKTGRYLMSFGGRGRAPYNFTTLHKLTIDTRFSPPRILACDRENFRMVHMSLDGELLGTVASDLLAPAAVVIQGDLAAIGEIGGAVSLLDKSGKVVRRVGFNDHKDEVKNNKTPPRAWRPGFVTAPHGVAFNDAGDLFVAEYSIYGRVHRFNRVKK